MREIRPSGLMSGDGKRSVLLGAQPPRPSSTLLTRATPLLASRSLLPSHRSRAAMPIAPSFEQPFHGGQGDGSCKPIARAATVGSI